MQLTVRNFLELSTQKCGELISLIFWDQENKTNEDFSLLTDEEFAKLYDLLRSCEKLSSLELYKNNLGNLGSAKLYVLFDNLSVMNLTELDLECNKLGSNNSLEIIINSNIFNYPCLKKLNLSNNNLGEIKELKTSSEYFLFYNNYNLEELDISSNRLGNSVEVFNFFMLQARNVKKLSLYDNQLNLLEDNLNFSVCSRLETLILADNDFSLIKASSFNCLIKYFATSNTLKKLELDNTNLQFLIDEDLNNLFDALIANSNLINLNLAENKLGLTQSIFKLGNLLKQNKLSKINLSENLLGILTPENYEYFINGIADSVNLKVLNISYNDLQKIHVDQLSKLAQALKNCCNLEKLTLGDEDVGNDLSLKLSPLFETLGELPNLTKLNLNYIWTDCLGSEENTVILSRFIQTTTSLKVLELDYGLLKTEEKIKQILSTKPSIKLKLI